MLTIENISLELSFGKWKSQEIPEFGVLGEAKEILRDLGFFLAI